MGWGEPLRCRPDYMAEVERLRSLVCALKEECAAREADSRRLAEALNGLHGAGPNGRNLLDLLADAAQVLDAHDDLTATYNLGDQR